MMLTSVATTFREIYIGDEWKRTSIGNGTFIDKLHPLGQGSVTGVSIS